MPAAQEGRAPAIVYDGLRLWLAASRPTPRGIDRVDFAYARFLFDHWPGECLGLLPTPWGMRLYDRSFMQQMLAAVEAAWRENQSPGHDPACQHVRDWLHSSSRNVPAPPARRRGAGWLRLCIRFVRRTRVYFGTSAISRTPIGAIYLNVGQLGWAAQVTTHWLKRRRDIQPVFMLHDIIPLQHPDLVSNAGRLAHGWMLRTVLRKAAGLITTTHSASDTVLATLRQHGLASIRVRAIPLPVADVFLQRDPRDEKLRRLPYFVVCGAIEPRKNHGLLLRVWRRLVGRIGAAAPRLVIVGSPAHRGAAILQPFLSDPDLHQHVMVVTGLASPSLRTIMAHAQALLMPSMAEGFGLPVIESLAVGTPVLASDIIAHREIGGDMVVYLDPADEIVWYDAIMDLLQNHHQTAELRQRIAGYKPLTGQSYFQAVQAFLLAFG